MASGPDPNDALAVVGMGVRLPGAETPEQLFDELCAGVDRVTELSAERIRETSLDPGAYYINAGYLDGIERFDAAAFGFTDQQAVLIDPQQRLALEVSLRAFEDAGITPEALSERTVSVFVNQVEQQYFRLHETIGPELVAGSTSNFLPAGLARRWNLGGGGDLRGYCLFVVAAGAALGQDRHLPRQVGRGADRRGQPEHQPQTV